MLKKTFIFSVALIWGIITSCNKEPINVLPGNTLLWLGEYVKDFSSTLGNDVSCRNTGACRSFYEKEGD